MKEHTMFAFSFLFGDHLAKCSDQAKLYYIKLNFFANNGFVSNPVSVLDSMGYDKSVYWELVENGDLLTLPNRSEVFITSYFVHNKIKSVSWLASPYAIYWKGKLYLKQNGIATFSPQGKVEEVLKQEAEQLKIGDTVIAVEQNKDDEEEEQRELTPPTSLSEWNTDKLNLGFLLKTKRDSGQSLTKEENDYLNQFLKIVQRK